MITKDKQKISKRMKHLLNPISWTTYLESITLLAIAYYAFIGWKYYRPEIKAIINRLTGQKSDDRELPSALKYTGSDEQVKAITGYSESEEIASYPQQIGATQELKQSLTACINIAAGDIYNPDNLIPKLKKILNDYPDIAATHEREDINALIVRECEKTGTALLSESEVDMWWSA